MQGQESCKAMVIYTVIVVTSAEVQLLRSHYTQSVGINLSVLR